MPPAQELSKRDLTLSYLPPKRNHQKRKRKIIGPNDLIPETVPLNDVRRSVPKVFSQLTSRAEFNEVRSQLEKLVESDDVTLIASTIENENLFGPVYREMKGLDAVSKFIATYFSAIPDCVLSFSNLHFFKRKNNESELHTQFSLSGCVTFNVVIDNAEQVGDLKSAVEVLQGLNGFNGADPDAEPDAEPENSENADEEEEEEESPQEKRPRLNEEEGSIGDDSSSAVKSVQSSNAEMSTSELLEMNQRKLEERQRKKRILVGEQVLFVDADEDASSYRNMIIASESTNYQLENRDQARSFFTTGTWNFFFNKDKKIYKMEARYSARKTAESARYDSIQQLTSSSANAGADSGAPSSNNSVDGHAEIPRSCSSDSQSHGSIGVSLIAVSSVPAAPTLSSLPLLAQQSSANDEDIIQAAVPESVALES